MPSRCCTVFLVFFSAVVCANAADWTEFRGPTGQGLSTEEGLPVEWSRTKNVVWKVPTPPGWSSPLVARGKVYLTAAVPQDGGHSLRALCLDAASGKTVWEREVFREGPSSPRPHSKNSHASPTPLLEGERLYVHFGHQGTACLDQDGKIVWTNSDFTYPPVHGNGGSPILIDDVLVFSCDGATDPFIVALDKTSGKLRWKTNRKTDAYKKFSFSTPLAIEVKGQKQAISPGSDVVSALDPATGTEIWRARYKGYSVIPRPVFGHGLVFVCIGYDIPGLIAIRTDGSGDVTDTHIAWRMRQGAPHTPSPLLVGNELYTVSDGGIATCLDARTGKPHWQKRLGGAFSASPLHATGRVYFQSEDGVGIVLAAATTFRQLARNDLGERSLASYAAADGALFIRTEKHLYRIGKAQRRE
jgi:outer membrane protein assembly factor BamB